MLKNLKNTVIGRASKFASFWAALIDGLSPSLGALIPLSPFFISRYGIISVQTALNLSVALSFLLIFFLGIYLGKISERNMIIHGIKTLFAGFSVVAILFLLNLT
jgi:predicted membrane protein (TIGR00267 family)